MARRTAPAAIEARAREVAQRMIARGERRGYRLRMAQDGRWAVLEAPWLAVPGPDAVRAVIAAWLDCDPDAFDLES